MLDELLAWAKEENALGFEKYQPYYETAVSKIDLGALKTLLAQAEAHRAAGEWKEAARDAGEALKLDHRNARALVIRAEAYLGLDRWDDAIRDTTEALGIEPRNVRAWCVRAHIMYFKQGQQESAIQDVTEALGIDPQNILALVVRANIYRDSQRLWDAIRGTSEALEVKPQNDEDLTYLAIASGIRAICHLGYRRLDEASRDARAYLEVEIKPNIIFPLGYLEELVREKMSDIIQEANGRASSPEESPHLKDERLKL